MATKKFDTIFGEVEVRNAMFDIDGTTLEEGIEIKSLDNDFDLIEIYGYRDVEDLTTIEVERLIDENDD